MYSRDSISLLSTDLSGPYTFSTAATGEPGWTPSAVCKPEPKVSIILIRFAQSIAAKDNAERYEVYQKMDAILVDELPVMPIYYYTRVHAVSPRVKGYYPTLLDNHPYKYIYVED